MNDADVFFGTKEPVEMPPAQITHFGAFPHIQDLCDAFLEEMEWTPDLYTIARIAAGANEFVLACGNNIALLIRATKKMKKNKMSIGSPRSCITYGREMLHVPDADSDEHRQKYLRGVDDET